MSKDLKVVVLGYMASGKTTVGKALAHQLEVDFVDLDHAIEQEVGKSVSDIFKDNGELFFRKKETQVLQSLLARNVPMVLALGGGTPCYGNNMDVVNQYASHSFYLKLSIGALITRIKGEKQQRPLVAGLNNDDLPEFIGKHLFERNAFYDRAKQTIACDGETITGIVDKIAEALG